MLVVLLSAVVLGINGFIFPGRSHTKNAECGQPHVKPAETRIVGGTPAVPYSWPWQAEICARLPTMILAENQTDGGVPVFESGPEKCALKCGGSLIDEEWILTAGHCVANMLKHPDRFGIKLGHYDYREDKEPGELVLNVSKVIRHPKFGEPHMYSHDIALLQLSEPVQYTKHIRPVCLPKRSKHMVRSGKRAYVTGWGTTSEGGDASTQLRQVSVPFLSKRLCNKQYEGEVDDTMECAGREGFDSCQGDSGGPLVTKQRDDKWYQVGVVSWGDGCAEKGHPGVYARTSAFCDFIKEHLGREICID